MDLVIVFRFYNLQNLSCPGVVLSPWPHAGVFAQIVVCETLTLNINFFLDLPGLSSGIHFNELDRSTKTLVSLVKCAGFIPLTTICIYNPFYTVTMLDPTVPWTIPILSSWPGSPYFPPGSGHSVTYCSVL